MKERKISYGLETKELDCIQTRRTEEIRDNQGAILWSNEGTRQAQHISLRKNFVRESTRDGIIRGLYCTKHEMVADLLTKPPTCTV